MPTSTTCADIQPRMFLTIITVTFNARQWIERTLHSVLRQTDTDYEYLLIDGASTDDTLAIARQYQPLFNGRMTIVSEPDNGLYYAMNKGIARAQGQFLWFMNAGDEIHGKNAIALLHDQADYDIIYGKALVSDANGKTTGYYHKQPPEHLSLRDMLGGLVVCHQALLVRRTLAPLYDTRYRIAADYDWLIRILKTTSQTKFIPEPVCRFLQNGLSQSNPMRAWKERFLIMRQHFSLTTALAAHIKITLSYILRKIKHPFQ